jgi:hypothetical protein
LKKGNELKGGKGKKKAKNGKLRYGANHLSFICAGFYFPK